MFSGEIYYYWPLSSVEKSLVKHRFSLYNLLRYYNAVAVMYSRNIPMAEKQIVCFQSKKKKICKFFLFITTILYWKRYFEKCVTNDF